MYLEEGCYTDMVTPFKKDGKIDYCGLAKNIRFQVKEGVTGIFLVGLAGESPTLSAREHKNLLKKGVALAREYGGESLEVFCGTGSNSLVEALDYTKAAKEAGCDGAVLIEPYYNRPPSKHIRQHYLDIAAQNRRLKMIPCTFPSLTGTSLDPQDLRDIDSANICGIVSEIRDSYSDVREIKKICSVDFAIFSAQDEKTLKMISDKSIAARGVFSVVANIAPWAIQRMIALLSNGKIKEAKKINRALDPLYRIVNIKDARVVGRKTIVDRYPSPIPIKAVMMAMGIPSGECRLPLYKMSGGGVSQAREAVKSVWQNNPWILDPLQDYYDIDIEERIYQNSYWEEVADKNHQAAY